MAVDVSARAAILAKLEARARKPEVDLDFRKGSEVPELVRIPTGSPMLDYATFGGIPMARWSRFWGGKMSGKSLTAWNIAREAQAMGLSVVYYNIEKQFEPVFTAKCGVNIEELQVVEGTTIEDIGEALEELLGVYHVHILDSCSEGTSLQEFKADYGDSLIAAKTRAWAQVFHKCARVVGDDNAVLYLDHARDVFGARDSTHPPGGKLMEHRSSLTLRFTRGGWLFRNKNGRLADKDSAGAGRSMSGRTEADGMEITVLNEKSRVGRAFRQAVMHYSLDDAKIDTAWELAEAATYLDADGMPAHLTGKPTLLPKTTEASHHYVLPKGGMVNGKAALTERLDVDDELRDYVSKALVAA